MSQKICIIGGGIAGLSTAWFLQRGAADRGIALDIELVEAADRLGGKIVTHYVGDSIVEGGPDSFLTEKQSGLELCRALGLGDQLLPSNDANRSFSIVHEGRLVPFPKNCRLFIPLTDEAIRDNPLLSEAGKQSMAHEVNVAPRLDDEDESLSAFVTRRFGREVLDRMAAPLLAGIYAADPDTMSIMSTFPKFRAMECEYGSLTAGARANAARGKRPDAVFTSLQGGLQSLVNALQEQLTCSIRLSTHLEGLSTIDADRIILTIPARDASILLEHERPQLASALREIRYGGSATLAMLFKSEELPERPKGFGFMATREEPCAIHGCTWGSNKFSGRTSPDHFLVRVFFTDFPANEHAMVATALNELKRLADFDAQPVWTRANFWNDGNPLYEVGHREKLERIYAEAEKVPGLSLTGSSYEGLSMSDCITNAKILADQLLQS
ncbi:MAG: oxygen-dependent protoporphyrinogen oxidase [Kiritimatiellia bacterium]|jgi:protoporphyrinogen/coproporphyrinogen III oxidase